MLVDRPDEGYIGSLREMQMALDFSPHATPVKVKIGNLDHTLRIAYVHHGDSLRTSRKIQHNRFVLGKCRLPHIHFQREREPTALQQLENLDAGSGSDAHRIPGQSNVHQESSRATRAVAGDLSGAAVGVEELNRRFVCLVAGRGLGNQYPSVGADSRMAVADRVSRL